MNERLVAPVPRPPRNERLDALLAEMAEILGPADDRLTASGRDTVHPVLLVVGPPRSGTTLLTQWLAASGKFTVPSNLLARFSRTPAIGARVQALLTDPRFAFGDELFDLAAGAPGSAFVSAVGKTRGALAPNEFAFFWRRLLRTPEMAPLGPEGIARADFDGIRASFAEIEAVLGRPVATKGMFVQYDLAAVAERMPRAVFLRIRRDPAANALALLAARERYHGDRSKWYSAKPAEYDRLRTLDPVRQCAGQVHFTETAIDAGLAALPADRSVEFRYEDFCAAPRAAWERLRATMAGHGCDVGPWPDGPERFEDTGRARAASPDAPAVAAALAEFRAD